jgi:hypothetical protein
VDSERITNDDLDVRRRWPGQEAEPGLEEGLGGQEAGLDSDPLGSDPLEDPDAVGAGLEPGPGFLARGDYSDYSDARMGAIAVRVDALASTTALLRTVIADRLSDYSNQVSRAQAQHRRDLEEHNRGHDRRLADIEVMVRECEEAVRRLETTASKLLVRVEGIAAEIGSEVVGLGERLEAAVAGLGDAQAEDLERMMDLIESIQPSGNPEVVSRLDAIAADQSQLHEALRALRRRMTLKARREPAVDDETVEQIAQAVVRALETRAEQPAALNTSNTSNTSYASYTSGAGDGMRRRRTRRLPQPGSSSQSPESTAEQYNS